MEHFFEYMSKLKLPGRLESNIHFQEFLETNGSKLIYELTEMIYWTLPSPRVKFYSSNDYFIIQQTVLKEASKVINDLGFFPVEMQLDLLKAM